MSGWVQTIVGFVALWLVVWAVLMAGCLALLVAVDCLKTRWQRYQRARQYRRAVAAELMRIDRETVASVDRINSAFMLARRLIRDEAAIHRGYRS